MTWNPEQPYNDLPLLPPPAEISDSPAILKASAAAQVEVAKLNIMCRSLPSKALLLNLIPILESTDSSKIENIFTTSDKLFQHAQNDKHADRATKEALRHRTALLKGYENLGEHPLNADTAIEICTTLKGTDMGIRKTPGTIIKNQGTGEILYTPPVGEPHIRALLHNLEEFLHKENGLDPLVKMAISHYQFEAIHPFNDGNGRTGRILNILYLIEQGLLDLPTLYLSRYIAQHQSDYYRGLREVTSEGQLEPWIIYMLTAVREVSQWTYHKVEAIKALHEQTRRHIQTTKPKIYSYELAQAIFEQPYCRISNLIDMGIAQRPTASSYLKQLVEIGVLAEVKFGRDKYFVHPKLLHLMTQDSNEFEPYP